MRIFSSAENRRRVARRICFTIDEAWYGLWVEGFCVIVQRQRL